MSASPVTPTDARPRRAPRRRVSWPAVRAQWPLALVIAGLLVGLAFVVAERWRRGTFVIGLAALAAAALRAALPTSRVGLLAVRGREFDVVFLVVTGVLVLWLSASVDSLGTG